jgi:hypothetical protein
MFVIAVGMKMELYLTKVTGIGANTRALIDILNVIKAFLRKML